MESEIVKLNLEADYDETGQVITLRRAIDVPLELPAPARVEHHVANFTIMDKKTIGRDKVNVAGRLNVDLIYVGAAGGSMRFALSRSIQVSIPVKINDMQPGDEVDVVGRVAGVELAASIAERLIHGTFRLVVNSRLSRHVAVHALHEVFGPSGIQVDKFKLPATVLDSIKEKVFLVKLKVSLPTGVRVVWKASQADVDVESVTVTQDLIEVKGIVTLKGIFRVLAFPERLGAVEASQEFSESLRLVGIQPGIIPRVEVKLVELRLPERDGDRFAEAVLSLRVKILRRGIVRVVRGIRGDEGRKFPKIGIPVREIMLLGSTQVMAQGDLVIPEALPPAAQALRAVAEAVITHKKLLKLKAIVRGSVMVKALYEAAVPEQTVHVVQGLIPFAAIIELSPLDPSGFGLDDAELVGFKRLLVNAQVEHVSVALADPRRLKVSVILDVTAMLIVLRKGEFVTDPDPSRVIPWGPEDYVVRGERVFVRRGPGLSYPAITTVANGVKLQPLKREGQWLQVKLPDGTEGYVMDAYLVWG